MRKKARGRKEGMRRCKVCGHKLDGRERVVPVVSLQALKEKGIELAKGSSKKNWKILDEAFAYAEAIDDILNWAKKQGDEKKKGSV